MADTRWMIYGATGYTGRLVAEQAVKRGHRPLLAGRSVDKLAPLAERLGLSYAAFTLDDVNTIAEAIADMDLVYHAAGPFIHTSDPMLRACLATGTHYMDITGEIDVLASVLSHHETAHKNNVALLPGMGFDVVPTDCLGRYVADKVPGAVELEIGITAMTRVTAGTARSVVEMLPNDGRVLRGGVMELFPLGQGQRTIQFPHARLQCLVVPWGDLATAYRSTGIPNVTTYMSMPAVSLWLARYGAGLGRELFRSARLRAATGWLLDRLMRGPGAKQREQERSYIWARAVDAEGRAAEAWLETAEAYRFTAEIAVLAVEAAAAAPLAGALTPSLAFGPDFVLGVEGTRRLDSLEAEDEDEALPSRPEAPA